MAAKIHVHCISELDKTSILFFANCDMLICLKKKMCIYNLNFDVKLIFERLWQCILDSIDFQNMHSAEKLKLESI